MINVTFNLFISYSQVALFDPNLQNPFNDWQPQHVAQGFAWRPESVSFRTLETSGLHRVEVQQANEIGLKPSTKRAILVPFSVKSSTLVEIASISDSKQISIPEGNYALIFENGYDNATIAWCRFTFIARNFVQAEILRADSELAPPFPLLMEAHAAE